MSKQTIFINAIKTNDFKTVKSLLNNEEFEPSAEDFNYAIRYASLNGHLEVVKLLLKDNRVDPSSSDCEALYSADFYQYHEIVDLLWKDKRVKQFIDKEKNKPEFYDDMIKRNINKKIESF
jgi:hypothetical protein